MFNYLCLSIDGLQSGMLGAYGNTWIHTPTLDLLACQSVLFDRFYASTMDLSAAFTEWWHMLPECRKILLTDDSDVFLHEQAGQFDEKYRTESTRAGKRKSPAALHQRIHGRANVPPLVIEKTQFFRNTATIADLLRNRSEKPFFLWAHFEGFRGYWDFPLAYRKQYQIDEDPDPYPGVDVPDINWHNTDTGMNTGIDPDVVQSVREAYSGGVTVLDESMSGLLAFLSAEGLDKNTVLLFTSLRGFSLGEHNRVGVNEELYGENVHLPLFIRFPETSPYRLRWGGCRSQTLLQPADIFSVLQKDDLPEEPDAVHSFIRIGNQVIVTPDWFVYRRSSGNELYVKPDDRWEVNNVADRCPHILEEIP